MGALRVSSLNEAVGKALAFANEVKPGSTPEAAMIIGGAGAFGVAVDREIWALLLDPQLSAQPYALVVPVVDVEQVKANPMLGLQAAETAGHYQLRLPNGQAMQASFVDNVIVLAPEAGALDAALAAVRTGGDLRGLRAAGGELGLSIAVDRVYAAYKPMLDMLLAGMSGQMAALNTSSVGPNPTEMIAAYAAAMAQLSSIDLRVRVQAEQVELRVGATAQAGTRAAALFDVEPGPVVETLGLHDPSSVVLGTMSARPSAAFWQAYNDWVADIFTLMNTPQQGEAATALKEMMIQFSGVWDGAASYGFLGSGPAISGSAVMGVTDADKLYATLKALPEMQKAISAINSAQGLDTEMVIEGEETVGDARLLHLQQRHAATTPEMMAGMEMLTKIGFAQMRTTYAVTPARLIYTLGEDAPTAAKALLTATPTASVPRAADFGLPEGTTMFTAVSLPGYFRWISQAMDGLIPGLAAVPASPSLSHGLGWTLNLSGGRAESYTVVKASEIAAFGTMMEAAQAAMAAESNSGDTSEVDATAPAATEMPTLAE